MKRPEDVPGWMTVKELDAIRSIAAKHQPRVVVEIGSFAGRSALAWAQALPQSMVWCVDLFDDNFIRDAIPLTGSLLEPDLTTGQRGRPIYSLFLQNTWGCPNIRHIRCDSWRLPEFWHGGKIDLVFIDGHHSFEAVAADLIVARTLGADVICGHDYGSPGYGGPEHKGVTTAVNKFLWAHPGYSFLRHPDTSIFEIAGR